MTNNMDSPTPSQQMVASCSGALITSFISTPFDVVKVRLQSQQANGVSKQNHKCFIYRNGLMDHVCVCSAKMPNTPSVCQWYERPGQFSGTWDAFVKIGRNEGFRSLWSGLHPTLIMAVPATICYFTLYDMTLAYLRGKHGYDQVWIPVTAGCTARVASATAISPLELIRTKMQSERLSYKQLLPTVRDSIRKGGVLTLWTGLAPTLYRDVPFSGLYWLLYESLKAEYMKRNHLAETNFAGSFVCGAISGTIAALITLPFDVIKTHRQIMIGEEIYKKDVVNLRRTLQKPSTVFPSYNRNATFLMRYHSFINKFRCVSTWCMIKELYKERGLAGLYSGAIPRVSKVAPACAIMIGSYEYAKVYFTHRNRESRLQLNN